MPTNEPRNRRPERGRDEVGSFGSPLTPVEGDFPGQASALNPTLDATQAALEQLRPGQQLGQYQILEQLGAGGMGLVFKAVHSAMQRTVALKIIAPELTQDPQTRARFQREVRSAARLNHPNVVVAHDAAEASGLWFLVMEYVPGTDAAHLFQRYGRPPIELACEIVRQAALGLQHAHELGMVHRDIKPANLMVTTASRGSNAVIGTTPTGWPNPPLVKILDFGLARLAISDPNKQLSGADVLTRERAVFGTPEYMAPEQAKDSRLADIRSDIYSLGCTLYALLAGRPPFLSRSPSEVLAMHLTQPPEPVSKFLPEVPFGLEQVIDRMLAKKPEDRYATPIEVAKALEQAAHSQAPSPTKPTTEPQPGLNFAFLFLIFLTVALLGLTLMLLF